jgi:ParB family chromosome partitioning protein
MTATPESVIQHGAVLDIPLSKLKKSPRNVRTVPHSEAAIEALAAGIAARGMLQKPVVEPETNEAGEPTGCFLVTIGEGRRLAQLLRAKRKEIRKTELVSCVVDLSNDPREISLDENVTRSDLHPADQFEAFRDLAERQGFGAEDIAARFGVSAQVVRQRLRLGAVSPTLMAIYREGGLTLDQLMAFAVSEDHARQEQVFEQLSYNRQPYAIRRGMTEAKAPASDRRAIFVGAEAYAEAGGTILRDLFTEDGGGWFEDVALLDRLAAEKLAVLAEDVRVREGWKWALASLDYPHGLGLRRVYPHRVERTPDEQAQIDAIAAEYDSLVEQWAHIEDLPAEVEARLGEIDAALEAHGDGYAFEPDEVARGGVLVALGQDGEARIERGLIRPEDEPPAPEAEAEPSSEADGSRVDDGTAPEAPAVEDEDEPDGLTPLSDRLVADLTAHRTAGLRDVLAENPHAAFIAVVHALVARTFYAGGDPATCLDLRAASYPLDRDAVGIEDSPAGRKIAERHEAWARQVPADAKDAWAFVVGLDSDSREALFAHCVGLTVNAVRGWQGRPGALANAEALASFVSLDMTTYWTPTARSYFERVTKARIGEAVREAVSDEAAERIAGLKKLEMAQAAEPIVAGTGWLPPILRTVPVAMDAAGADDEPAAAATAPPTVLSLWRRSFGFGASLRGVGPRVRRTCGPLYCWPSDRRHGLPQGPGLLR